MTVALLTMAAVALLAFANGANDVSKGIATLAGSGRTTYRRALAWGTLWTAAGAGAAILLSYGLVTAFTSALVAADVLARPPFPLAVAAAASAWVLFASATGLPVSTTHALTGSMVGAAFTVGGSAAINWWLVATSIAAPLALSPLASAACGYGLYGVARRIERACVCTDAGIGVAVVRPDGTLVAAPVRRVVASVEGCDATPDRVRLLAGQLTHWGRRPR